MNSVEIWDTVAQGLDPWSLSMAYDSVLCRAWARKGIIDGVNGPKYAQPLSELMSFAHGFCTFSKEVNSTSPLLKFELMLQLALAN